MSRCSVCGKHKLSTEPDPCLTAGGGPLRTGRAYRAQSAPRTMTQQYNNYFYFDAPSLPRSVPLSYRVSYEPYAVSSEVFPTSVSDNDVRYISRVEDPVPLTEEDLNGLPTLVDDYAVTE